MDLGVHPENSITYNIAAELANKENIDMIHEVKEQSSGELAQARAEWEERMQRIHHLESEAEASQVLAREACSERDELRGMLDQKQVEMRVEDQETINEMKKLLAGLTAQDDSSQTSGVELTRQLADLIDKNLERLAQRAEVRPSCLVCLASFTVTDEIQYIEQQNQHIKSLRQRIKNFEENNEDGIGISREREVSLHYTIAATTVSNAKLTKSA